MKKRPSTQITMNSDPDLVLSDDMRKLIIAYMTACNEGQTDLADSLLEQIKEKNQNDAR